MHFQNLAVCKS